MTRHIRTISDAAHEWVREMNAIPQDMVESLMLMSPDSWREITLPSPGDRVWSYEHCAFGEVLDFFEDTEEYSVLLDSGETICVSEDEISAEYYGELPIWGTMWSFGDSLDDEWLQRGGLRKMSHCGFRVYESDEWGYFFGIDGAGYSFYEAHWIPLYRARGLRWHDEEERSDGR